MIILSRLTCLWLLASVSSLSAQENDRPPAPILIKNSRSPDGHKEITITDISSEGMASGVARIRDTETGKSSGSFAWSGFGVHPTEDAFEVLWKPDSRAFAIKYESTRGYISCDVYMLTNTGRCRRVQLPAIVAYTARKYGLRSDDKGGEHPTKWLPQHRLIIDEYNRAWSIDDWQDKMQPYQVTLRLPARATELPLKATIESVHPVNP